MSDIDRLRPHLNTILLTASEGGQHLAFKPILSSHIDTQENFNTKHVTASFNQDAQFVTKQPSDYAHLAAPKINSIDELVIKINQYISILEEMSQKALFQNQKRQNKINALRILERGLIQWNDLYRDKNPLSSEYNTIVLDKNAVISTIANPHTDPNVTRNREFLIKRIEQYVLANYPDAYQSFFREQGEVEILFKQGFDLMRRMKTEKEIHEERQAIEHEISDYEVKFQSTFYLFESENKKQEREESLTYLRNLLQGNENTTSIKSIPGMVSSLKANGTRYQIYQKIHALEESQELLIGPQAQRLKQI